MDLDWFEDLFGFEEDFRETVRREFLVEGSRIRSRANGRAFEAGHLEVPNLASLRARSAEVFEQRLDRRATTVEEWIADARGLHRDPRAAGALVQVASQFNLLEMIGPHVTPEEGITGYVHDPTQGPACAVAAAAGLVYRAYLHPVAWILDAIAAALEKHRESGLDVVNVSHRRSNPEVVDRIDRFFDEGRGEG